MLDGCEGEGEGASGKKLFFSSFLLFFFSSFLTMSAIYSQSTALHSACASLSALVYPFLPPPPEWPRLGTFCLRTDPFGGDAVCQQRNVTILLVSLFSHRMT